MLHLGFSNNGHSSKRNISCFTLIALIKRILFLRCSKSCEDTPADSDLCWQQQELCRCPSCKECSQLSRCNIRSNGWTDNANGAVSVNGHDDPGAGSCKICSHNNGDCELKDAASRGCRNCASTNSVSCSSDCDIITSKCHSNKNCIKCETCTIVRRRCRRHSIYQRTEPVDAATLNLGKSVESEEARIGCSGGETGGKGSRVNEEYSPTEGRSPEAYSIDRQLTKQCSSGSVECCCTTQDYIDKCSCAERSTEDCSTKHKEHTSCKAHNCEERSDFEQIVGDCKTKGPLRNTLDSEDCGGHRSRRDRVGDHCEQCSDRPSSDREDSLIIDESLSCDGELKNCERTIEQVSRNIVCRMCQ